MEVIKIEKYLIEQYDVFEDVRWLTKESEIVDYFKDAGRDFLECGQGFYQDEADIICKIADKFYNITIHAEMMSAKQDVGDRLYWVDYISNIEFEEIEKPLPKEKINAVYELSITENQKRVLEEFMKENHIDF